MLIISAEAKESYPELMIGIMLISNIKNTYQNEKMVHSNRLLENELREKYGTFDRIDLNKTEVLSGYNAYCKKYTKTYHVLLQLESIVFKNKQIPSVSPIVQSMFMGEMKNHFLSSVHDFSYIEEPLDLKCSSGIEEFTLFNGEKKILKKDDLYIKDKKGIISAILFGMDERTKVTEKTSSAFYTVYVPFKTCQQKVKEHLLNMAEYLKLNDEQINVEYINVYS